MSFKTWKEEHSDLWQFVLFNILCNISTISRFVCVWVGTAIFVNALQMNAPFQFWLFDYTSAGSNYLGGFITFLIAEVVAQVVNFVVQFTLVFKSDSSMGEAAWKYAVLAVIIVVMNLILPSYVTSFCQTSLGLDPGLAGTVASCVNTLAAVVISWPMLKFWIMPDSAEEKERKRAVKERKAAKR
jgi:hypothetical protein